MITKDNLPLYLAIIVALGFMTFLLLIAFHDIPTGTHDLMLTMVGWLGGSFTTVVGYYYGSSAGSAEKTKIMATTTPTDKPSDPIKPPE